MIRKTKFISITLIFFLVSTTSAFQFNDSHSFDDINQKTGNTIYVNHNNTEGPWDGTLEHPYRTIQDGVFNSSNGDTVFVFKGTYHDYSGLILIDKQINLIGENRNETILQRLSPAEIIHITADYATISNFTLFHLDYNKPSWYMTIEADYVKVSNINFYSPLGVYATGLTLNQAKHCIITDNYFGNKHGFEIGIYIKNHSAENIISNNTFYYSLVYSILISTSTKNKITNNNIRGITIGIKAFHESDENVFSKNIIQSCQYCIVFSESCDNVVEQNHFAGNRLAAFYDCKNTWNNNYWERERLFPKIIFGHKMIGQIKIPMFDFDLKPSRTPLV